MTAGLPNSQSFQGRECSRYKSPVDLIAFGPASAGVGMQLTLIQFSLGIQVGKYERAHRLGSKGSLFHFRSSSVPFGTAIGRRSD
jgi:hypothetical protein